VARRAHYNRDDVVRAFRDVGVRAGDVVFTHASVAMLGVPEEGLDQAAIGELFLSAFHEVAGPEGTWILPAYTYSYTKDEVFDPAATPPTSDMGALPLALWRHPEGAPFARPDLLGGGDRRACRGDDERRAGELLR